MPSWTYIHTAPTRTLAISTSLFFLPPPLGLSLSALLLPASFCFVLGASFPLLYCSPTFPCFVTHTKSSCLYLPGPYLRPVVGFVGAALLAARVSLLNWGVTTRSSRLGACLLGGLGIRLLGSGEWVCPISWPIEVARCGKHRSLRNSGAPEMNCGPPDQLPPATAPSCFLNLNWDQSMDAAAAGGHPMVSSPTSNSTVAAATEGLAFYGISPQPHYGGTPLSSPPKLNLSMMGQFHHCPPPQVGGAGPGGLPILENLTPMGPLDQFLADPDFAERAARLSGFDARSSSGGYGGAAPGQFGLPHAGPVGALKELELGNARDEPSVSDPASASAEMALKGASEGNARKRKAGGKAKGKDGPMSTSAKDLAKEDSSAKRCKSTEESNGAEENSAKGKAAQSNSENGGKKHGKDSTSKPPEPPKDYIHVRARRGEATDSHSLAERVRREKISQRMKLLQDLVPGCNKVVGKAVMLDEIINYVQSLQRQVEFLSMKLATVNPQLDFNDLPNLLPKDMHQSCGPLQNSHFPLETSGAPLPYINQPHQGNTLGCGLTNGMDNQGSMHPLDSAFCRPMGSHHPFLNGVSDAASQVGAFWQDDLQSVVQMDMGQSQEIATSSNSYNGSLQTVHMKMEL